MPRLDIRSLTLNLPACSGSDRGSSLAGMSKSAAASWLRPSNLAEESAGQPRISLIFSRSGTRSSDPKKGAKIVGSAASPRRERGNFCKFGRRSNEFLRAK